MYRNGRIRGCKRKKAENTLICNFSRSNVNVVSKIENLRFVVPISTGCSFDFGKHCRRIP
jgi:hypothetical protein